VAPFGQDPRGFGVTDVKMCTHPTVSSLQAQTAAGLVPPTLCNSAPEATLVISGTAFWSISDGTSGRLPTVSIVDGATTVNADAVTLTPAGAGQTFSATTITAHFTFGAPLPIGPVVVRITNANGCTADVPSAFNAAVASCPVLGTLLVTPRFGWEQQNQPVTITNQFSQPATQPFSGGAPQAFILAPIKGTPGNQRVPLRRVAFLDQGTITAVVPTCTGLSPSLVPSDCTAGLQAGGPYDIDVVDPSGATGRIARAFTVVLDQPPAFAAGPSALNPASINAAATVRISGAHFDTPVNQHATVFLGTPATGGVQFCPVPPAGGGTTNDTTLDVAVPASFAAAGCYVEAPNGTRTPGAGFSLTPGLYLVRVQHTGDVAFADYSGLIVVASSFNPTDDGVASSTLSTARGSAGAAVGTDDLGQPFLYVVGGSTNGTDELASVEVAPIGPFGDLGGDCTQSGCKFRALDRTPLPSARAGLNLVARTVTNDTTYLFAIGGRSGTTASSAVTRAQVLRNIDAPVVTSTGTVAGTLQAGTWYYRVSAIRPASDAKNPAGETLASDEQPITLGAAGGAKITWACTTAQKYRVYRTASPNQPSGTEALLAEQNANAGCVPGTGESFTDDGSGSITAGTKPLPAGALGAWAASGEGVPQLGAARFEAASRLVGNTIYVVGGCSSGTGSPVACNSADLADMERARFAAAGDTAPGAFSGSGTAVLGTARRRHSLAVADAASVPNFAGNTTKSYLVAAGGQNGTGDISGHGKTVEIADLSVGSPSFTTASDDQNLGSGGWAEIQAGLFFWEMSSTARSSSPKAICSGTGCDTAGSFDFRTNSGFPTYQAGGARYLAGEQLFRAFIYVVGGFTTTGLGTPSNSVERIVY
jgi:hypothetical protein